MNEYTMRFMGMAMRRKPLSLVFGALLIGGVATGPKMLYDVAVACKTVRDIDDPVTNPTGRYRPWALRGCPIMIPKGTRFEYTVTTRNGKAARGTVVFVGISDAPS